MVDGSPERGSLFIPRPTTAACGWWHYLLDCHATLAVTLERRWVISCLRDKNRLWQKNNRSRRTGAQMCCKPDSVLPMPSLFTTKQR